MGYVAPVTIKNCLFTTVLGIISASPIGFWGQVIWGFVLSVVATKAEKPHRCTNTFQGDTGN